LPVRILLVACRNQEGRTGRVEEAARVLLGLDAARVVLFDELPPGRRGLRTVRLPRSTTTFHCANFFRSKRGDSGPNYLWGTRQSHSRHFARHGAPIARHAPPELYANYRAQCGYRLDALRREEEALERQSREALFQQQVTEAGCEPCGRKSIHIFCSTVWTPLPILWFDILQARKL
jgi:hypothetical protein